MLYAVDEDGSGLSKEQLEDTTLSLLFAGYDTTASTASMALLRLAQHPNVGKITIATRGKHHSGDSNCVAI